VLRSAAGAGPDVKMAGAAAYYRAMRLWRLGWEGEALAVAARAAGMRRSTPSKWLSIGASCALRSDDTEAS